MLSVWDTFCSVIKRGWSGFFFKTNFMITLIIYIRTTDTQRDWMIFHFEEERDTVCVQNVWTITDNFFFIKMKHIAQQYKKNYVFLTT